MLAEELVVREPTYKVFVVPKVELMPASVKAVVELEVKRILVLVALIVPEVRVKVAVPELSWSG